MRYIAPILALAACALADPLRINDANFNDRVALTVLERLTNLTEEQLMMNLTESGDQSLNDMMVRMIMESDGQQQFNTTDAISRLQDAQNGEGATTPWPLCQQSLACTLYSIQSNPLVDQLLYLVTMEVKWLGSPAKCSDQFEGNKGILQYFIDKGYTGPNTGISYPIASMIEGIQRGAALVLGPTDAALASAGSVTDTFGNPSTVLWQTFINGVKNGIFKDRASHDKAWSLALQSSLNYGNTKAVSAGITLNVNLKRWFNLIQVYCLLQQAEGSIKNVFNLVSLPLFSLLPSGFSVDKFVNWVFDVTSPKPLYCLSDAAWTNTNFDNLTTTSALLSSVTSLTKILPAFLQCFSLGCSS
ncbi:hypothetical protein B0T19DRAFT_398033 [Cercophora scortea]|uniref:Uncharacterized protein n=1 Tax=Cercophora scortea TaxID=314031 RepID=A0AAE0MHD2_9PEZI|nr:hypothetical protein B0T19DRAFT_398033 [Cercophora scortea]